jgi:hypothetical protein
MTKKTVLSAVVVAGLAAAALLAFAAGRSALAGQLAITLDPPTAENLVGTDHTVAATISGAPPGATGVTFTVTSGPNTGATFTCSVNADCTTDGSNQVSGTYTGDGGVGQDTIEACIQLIGVQAPPCDQATKDWVQQPTPTPTPTPSPTATPTAVVVEQLPPTGGQPSAGSDFPWFLAGIVALGALAFGGGMLLRRRAR